MSNRIQQVNKPGNIDEREARIKRIATFSRTALEGSTVAELRELGSYLIPNFRKMKKDEIIQALWDIGENHRNEMVRQRVVELKLMRDLGVEEKFFEQAYISKITPEQAAMLITDKWKSDGLADSTMAKTNPVKVRLQLEKMANENLESKTWCDETIAFIKKLSKDLHRAVNKQYDVTMNEYGDEEHLIKVEGKKILDWAEDVIDWASNQDNLERNWHKVSFALALTSGRRMDEIHGHTQYDVLDEKTLIAVGLSKKPTTDYTLESLCLVNAYKWLNALNKLPEKRRNQDNGVVHNTIRKLIWDVVEPTAKGLGFRSYKDTRDFYATYIGDVVYDSDMPVTLMVFVRNMIGHESKKETLCYGKMKITDAKQLKLEKRV